MSAPKAPKLFISYSWSNQDHEAWVINLAEELVSQGVSVVLDKWDLQPGHDANAFMESMVTDAEVTKVILVCDRKYVEKSDRRSGGAGTEAQIITPELYAKKAQDKFVAVVRERDETGKPFLPVFYGGRIYIDLTSPSTYSEEFDRLLRWVWDQPLYVRPELGLKPGFLTEEQPKKIATSVAFRRAQDALKADATNSAALVEDYFSTLVEGFELLRIVKNKDVPFDEVVVQSIEDFLPLRNESVEIFSSIARFNNSEEMLNVTHRFFERLLPYTDRPKDVNQWQDTDFDNYRFIVSELFLYLIATFIRAEKYNSASYFLDNPYYWSDPSNGSAKLHAFTVFCTHVKSLDIRKDRLKLNRLSLHADFLHDRAKGTGIDLQNLMAADFVLYLRGLSVDEWRQWWPDTLVYSGRVGGAFEMFARAKSSRYFQKIKGLLGVSTKEELGSIIAAINSGPGRGVRWQYHRFSVGGLVGYDDLDSVP